MSTNFYAVHIPTEQEYKEMKVTLAARQLEKLHELLNRSKKQYHIGKRSCGWQFMFVPHTDARTGEIISPWEDNLASIKEYLSRDNVQIVDEYGVEYTVDEFFEEIKDILYHSKKAMNGSDYDREYSTRYRIDEHEYTTEEGLRFATDDDWS